MDLAEKAQAIQTLVSTFATLGDEERIDGILEACRGSSASAPEEKKKTGAKRGPYKVGGLYKALEESGVMAPASIPEKVEHYQYVPGKSQEEKVAWVVSQLRKSKQTYREYPDGSWGLRNDKGPPIGK